MKEREADSERLDAAIVRALRHERSPASPAGDAVLARLAARPLPAQDRPFRWWRWPGLLLDSNFAPAWPRIAAFAGIASLGIAIGLAGPDLVTPDSGSAMAFAAVPDVDLIPLDNVDGAIP